MGAPSPIGSPTRALVWRAHWANPSGLVFETFEWTSDNWLLVITGADAVGQSSGADLSWTFGYQPNTLSIFGAIAADTHAPDPVTGLYTFSWRGALPLGTADQVSAAIDGDLGSSFTLWGYLLADIDTGSASVPPFTT